MPRSAKADRRLRNMAMMIDRLGFSADTLGREPLAAELRSAVRVCRACTAEEMCRDWLAHAPAAFDHAPEFCPNQELLARVRGERTSA